MSALSARLAAPSVRHVLQVKRLCRERPQTALPVDQVTDPHQTVTTASSVMSKAPCFWTGMHKPAHQTMCQICNSGFYQIQWGQENCDVCPENHYCPVSPPHIHTCTCSNTRPNKCVCDSVCVWRVQMWTPSSVPATPSVPRAVWPRATAWRPSLEKQGTPVN